MSYSKQELLIKIKEEVTNGKKEEEKLKRRIRILSSN